MRRRLARPEVDVWPAFTDFLTSVSFLLVALLMATPWFFSLDALLPRGRSPDDPLKDIKKAQKRIEQVLQGEKGIQVVTGLTDQRLIFNESQGALFATDSAVLNPRFRARVLQLARRMRERVQAPEEGETAEAAPPRREAILDLVTRIEVEGHSDNQPFPAGSVRTNWELSAERAAAVVKVLQQGGGIPGYKLSAKGFAEYRPFGKELQTGDPAGTRRQLAQANRDEAARKRNRRIEVLLLYSDPGAAARK